MTFETTNPATGERIDTYEPHDDGSVDAALSAADSAAETWRSRSAEARQELAAELATVLRDRTKRYARLMAEEMGKPVDQGVGEIEKCAWLCDHYAENAAAYLHDERIGSDPGAETYIAYEPLGAVLGVMPWNFPFWQVFRFAVPAVTAGNTALLKHSPTTFGCAAAIESAFRDAGYPDAVFQSLRIEAERVADVVADDRIRAVTLTGSTRAGRAVAETAGRNITKTVLELGGSDPYVVLDDADLDAAVNTAVTARTQNGGQSCIAAKRLLVHTAVYDEFLDRFVDRMEAQTVGDPTSPETDIGPQARADLRSELHEQVEASVAAGATCRCGGDPIDGDGFYYPPTVLTDAPADCPARTEELFGPVATVIEVADEAAAVAVANETDYGLSASVWTEDRKRGRHVAERIDAGAAFVNEMSKSDPRLPFGGVKDSGYGLELSRHGIREFTNAKTYWIE
ncbi:NAD-dependent succinate-semialdehyde dehydrogenase [Haloarcula sp. Atlit-7R]|uniref:NAD-dependent succinate-semialdehyde dehydrogenase n=1 Tax=Haloarcula sp. Atlit-7R TaxID=2282125 RepID=UPI000EF14FD0|nr:NAD-dependent succinate-semialdehyde dehydrogenase [Haloarcula sp. Atlit-7R]RLM90057.1 NAD-dependent succinate-semialdehyde dehydrogenase [Haloarcula sp. Atlit-7R]